MRFFSLLLLFVIFSARGQTELDTLLLSLDTASGAAKLEVHKSILRINILGDVAPSPQYYFEAVEEARRQRDEDYVGIFHMYGALIYQHLSKFDSALMAGRKSLRNLTAVDNTLWASGMAHTMARLHMQKLQYDSAILYALQCLDFHEQLELNPGRYQAVEMMARIYEQLEDVPKALSWNRQLLTLATENDELYYQGLAHMNIGNAYDIIQKYDSSIYHKKVAAGILKDNWETDYYILLGNIGNTYLLWEKLDSALLYTRVFYDDVRSKDFPYWMKPKDLARSAINLGAIYYKMGDYARSLKFLEEGIEKSKAIDFKDKVLEAHYWLYKMHKGAGNLQSALYHHESYLAQREEAQDVERKKEVERLTVEYETEKKEQQLKVLEAQKELQAIEIVQTRYLVLAVVLLAVFVITAILLLNSRKRYKLKALLAEEKEHLQKTRFKAVIDAEERERKRIARELHDGLGQLLSTARITLSSIDGQERKVENCLKLIDHSVDEVRSISHNLMPNALISAGLEATLKDLARKVSESGKVQAVFKCSVSMDLDEPKAIMVYRVVQEVVNNALKYADASEIQMVIGETPTGYQVTISDNGKGFDTSAISRSGGIGWANVQSRIELIGGEMDIFSKLAEGTTVKFTIPLYERAYQTAAG